MNKRLFIAIGIPNTVRNHIEKKLLTVLRKKKGIKVVLKEQLHITLFFLGSVPQERLPPLKESLHNVNAHAPFEIRLKEIGTFTNRVMWLGTKNEAEQVSQLAQTIENGLNKKNKLFFPHVTLCRNKKMPLPEWNQLAHELAEQNPVYSFKVNRIELMESIPQPNGSFYRTLFAWSLKKTS